MSHESRFDRLERAPEDSEDKATLPGPTSLTRFEEDGGAGLHLDRTDLAQLPMRQCVECERDSSKFDELCIYCGASLTTPQAVVHNLQLLEARRLAADIELEAEREKRDAGMTARANEEAERILRGAQSERERLGFQRKLISIGVSLAALIGLISVSSIGVRAFFFTVFLISLGLSFDKRLKP